MTTSTFLNILASIALITVAAILFVQAFQTTRTTNTSSVFQLSSVRGAAGGANCEEFNSSPATTVQLSSSTLNRTDRPPLSDLLEYDFSHAKIKGDVRDLMDFAIVGHPKCATTFLMYWLAQHEKVQLYTQELGELRHGQPARLVQLLYDLPDPNAIHGYKNPTDITNPRVLDYYAEYWPNTKFIVGMRHPILWFESFYNYRAREGYIMPPANSTDFIGNCRNHDHGVCTDQSLFHQHLSYLGKTSHQQSKDELKLLGTFSKSPPKKGPLPNKVFLYEVAQLHDENDERASLFRRDLGNYIGLNRTLTPHEAPYRKKENVLNICLNQYEPLRRVLLNNAKSASQWIRTYFMDHPDVFVSSPDFFRSLLEGWMVDPCIVGDRAEKERSGGH